MTPSPISISSKLSIEEKPQSSLPNSSKSSTTPMATSVDEQYSAVHLLNHLRSMFIAAIYTRS
jgi:hypothetical protein